MAIEGENLGVATIYLTVDKTSMDATIGKAKLQLAGMGAEASKQYDAMSASQQKMAQGYVKQIEMLGKTRAEQIAYNAQLKITGPLGDEIAAKALANAQATIGAQQEATAATKAAADAQAEMAAAEDARFKQIASDAMAEVEARQAITAATMEQARANAALIESRGTVGVLNGANAAGTLESSIVQQQIADYAALDAVMSHKVVTTEEVAAAEAALDRLQAAGMISNEDLAESFAALDKATITNTAELEANTAANLANAGAKRINSRTAYTISALFTDAASGQLSRSRREMAALANETGVLQKLMSPTGLAIGGVTLALIAFGKTVYDREKDVLAFNKALAATGDFAGQTGLQLEGIAAQVGFSTGSYSDATKAVLALAQSGDVLGSHLTEMATIAVNMAYVTGESVDKVVKQLISLQGNPTEAIAKTASAMGMLTAAQYDQIVETQQQQGVTAAAALAMKDLADASDNARSKLVDNAGLAVRAWQGFKSTLSDIGRALGSIGAQESVAEKIADQMARIKTIQARSPWDFGGDAATKRRDIADANAQIAALQQQQKTEAMISAGQELANQAKKEHDQALAEALASKKQGDEGFVAQAAVINRKRYEALVGIVDPSIRDRINAAYDQQIRDAVKRANEQLPHGGRTGRHSDPAAAALATFQSQVNGLTDKSIGVDGDAALTKYVQGVAKLNDEFDKATAKGADVTKATEAFNQGVAALNRTLDTSSAKLRGQEKAAIDGYKASLDKANAALQLSVNNEIAKIGMGDKEYQLQMQINKAYQEEAAALEKLEQQRETNTGTHGAAYADAVYKQDVSNLKAATAQKVQIIKDGYTQMDAAQANWVNGAIAAMQNWADQGANVADQAKTLFTDAFTQMNDALVNFVQTGKLNFSQLADSIIADLVRMELRIVESQILQSILGAFMPSGASIASSYMSGGGASFAASGVNWNVGLLGSANGNVFSGPGIAAYANQIVTRPTFFASGANVMGEDGPEAIMPLSRGSDGKLGVRAEGSGGNTTVIVENHSDSKAQVQQSKDSSGGDIIKVIVGQAVNEVDKRIARGGSTAQMLQQAFGLSRRGVPVAG